MCLFTRPVFRVANTQILSCDFHDGRQWTTYSTQVAAPEELAMVLPLPVAANTLDIELVDLSTLPNFFHHLKRLFPAQYPPSRQHDRGGTITAHSAPIKVHDVGDFDASFVPTPSDFERLDSRFVIPASLWHVQPKYSDYGFAVFKLKGFSAGGREPRAFHPMSFVFPRKNPRRIFFPTLHLHDGELHDRADFDHDLYTQVERNAIRGWERSEAPVQDSALPDEIGSKLLGNRYVFRRRMVGSFPNADVEIAV